MSNLLSASYMDVYSWIIVAVFIIALFLLRICMKNYMPSFIMVFLFSIATVVLSIFAILAKEPLDYGPWLFYTTFSILMFCLGPTYYFEGEYYEVTVHVGLFSNTLEGATRSRSYRFYYFFSRLAMAFITVNIVGFGGGALYILFVVPAICTIITIVRLVKYLR